MFTLDGAQNLIPFLKEICSSISPLRNKVKDLNVEIKTLQIRMQGNGGAASHNHLDKLNSDLKSTVTKINEKISDIEAKGIIIKSIDPGLFDFEYVKDGREVYLCWKEGEDNIAYWHEKDTGFAGREKL
ncbi:MAG: DUF2203 family protein [SAR202 cluster bacterium]|nr:DUF2203 family protein [SAR202 cluster bacterium]|tara:strand:+ start:1116 stop:1502 length:387 start_codon:yes stop_codon:yes gene_type:complete